jgi:hypothetical protein
MKVLPQTELAIRVAGARVRGGFPWWLRPFLFPGVIALTLGRVIYIAPDAADIDRHIRHELVHVRQMSRLGLLRFLWRYMREYLGHRWRGLDSATAYRRISLEEEAFAAEGEESV